MNRKKINPLEHANEITAALKSGVLVTTKAEDRVNSMVVGWGSIGVNWGRPCFTVYIREGRFTTGLLDKNPEFTVSVPVGEFDKKIIAVCGGKSGRDTDKIAEAGLTLIGGETISVPAVAEFPLTLECRVLYSEKQDLSRLGLDDDTKSHMYPQDVPGTAVKANRDAHITYYGEITDAFLLEP